MALALTFAAAMTTSTMPMKTKVQLLKNVESDILSFGHSQASVLILTDGGKAMYMRLKLSVKTISE